MKGFFAALVFFCLSCVVLSSPFYGYEPKCPSYFTGYLPYPNNCLKFLHCDFGRTFIKNCSPGTAFNPQQNLCVWPANGPSYSHDHTQNLYYGNGNVPEGDVFEEYVTHVKTGKSNSERFDQVYPGQIYSEKVHTGERYSRQLNARQVHIEEEYTRPSDGAEHTREVPVELIHTELENMKELSDGILDAGPASDDLVNTGQSDDFPNGRRKHRKVEHIEVDSSAQEFTGEGLIDLRLGGV